MEEQALIRGLREGREDCAEVFLARYRAPMQHCIARFERDPGLREDLLQELSQHLLQELARGRFDESKGTLGSWAYRIVWCRCVDRKRRRRPVEADTPGADLGNAVDPAPGPVESTSQREIGELVQQALAELEPEEADLLRLRHMEGLAMPELAEQLGLTLETAKYRLKQATIRLRGMLLVLEGGAEVPE